MVDFLGHGLNSIPMNPIRSTGRVEIQTISGQLIVSISPRPNWAVLAAEAAMVGVFALFASRAWSGSSWWVRLFLGWGIVASIIGWLYQWTGSETIEVDARQFAIRKEVLGWTRYKTFPIEHCRGLAIHERREGDRSALEVKVGRRTVGFGDHISEDEAIEILTALQRDLPEVADRLMASPAEKSHFTTLKLT